MNPPVITQIVEHDLCIGCGVCASLCPQRVLEMRWNRYGEYNPVATNACTTECGVCLTVCPFADNQENEDTIGNWLYGGIPGIKHQNESGYYLASYVGYSETHRLKSASGGIATWILETLLTEGIVDHVICVAPNNDPERLFAFRVFDTPEDVRKGAGSAYYPVEMSEVIRHVLSTPGKYAITGLPCFIKAIRLAQQRNKKLRDRIVVTVGLTCGQLKSRYFTAYVASLAGVQQELKSVQYRGKSADQPANNYYYTFEGYDGSKARIFWKEGIAKAWVNRWFTIPACDYCDDIFAECADVTCMDAWLPEYSQESKGTSLIIVRSLLAEGLIQEGIGDRMLSVKNIPLQNVILSQAEVIDIKRKQLTYRLHLAARTGKIFSSKRESPAVIRNPLKRLEVRLRDQMQVRSRQTIIINHDGENLDLEALEEEMEPYLVRFRVISEISRIIMLPLRAIHYILRGMQRN